MIVLRSKLLVPTFTADRQPRERLTKAVRRGAKCGAVLLVAPAGYGKTVLLAEVVESSMAPVVWLQLDDSDNDPAAFVAALFEGVRRAFPETGGRLAEAFGATPGGNGERHLTMLVNSFVDNPEGDWTLVLDDLHLVSNPEVLALIARLVDAPVPGLCVLMASRSRPSLPVARWLARGVLEVLSTEDLRFTADEAGDLLRRELPGLADQAVTRLVERTEGWPVGLRLATQLLRDSDEEAVAELLTRLQGTHPLVAGFLLEEVLSRETPELQRFLLDTAVLQQFDIETCSALLDGPGAPQGGDRADIPGALEQLELGHAFLQQLDDDGCWYRYHQLFREFLLSVAQRRDPRRVADLRRRAAGLAESRGEIDTAVNLHLSAGDLPEAARLLASHGQRHLRAGRGEALHRWLVQLEPLLTDYPELRFLHGLVLHQRGRLSAAIATLREARRAAIVAGRADLACAAASDMAAIARSQGDYLRAQEFSQEATAGADEPGVRAATRASAWLERAKIEGHLGGMPAGRQMAERAMAELEDSGSSGTAEARTAATAGLLEPDPDADAHLHAAFACSLGQICWWHGDVDAAVKHLQTALQHLGDADTPQVADVRLALATPALYRFDHAASMALAEKALKTYQRFELHERLPAAYAVLGNALTRAGEFDRAEACLRQAMATAAEIGGASYDHVMAAGYLAYLLELQGRTLEAIQVAEEALWTHEGAPTVYEVYVCRSVLADTYLSAGRPDKAEKIYGELVELGEVRQYRVPLALAYFGLAYLSLLRGERERGAELATRSLDMMSPTHAWQLYADQGERARLVVAAMRERRQDDPFLARVEAALRSSDERQTPAQVKRENSPAADDVSVSALGEMQVTVGELQLAAGAWVSAKAHDLLAYLVTLRSENVRADQALEALWPDEPERAPTAFHTALYRLRGALRQGQRQVQVQVQQDARKFVLVEGRKYRLDMACIAVDVDRFDTLIAQARRAEPRAALELLSTADAMVRGDYLAGLDYPWVHGERRRIAETHVEALALLASMQHDSGRNDAAVATARRWAAQEPYSERACVAELRSLTALGDLAGAERRYKEFEELLMDELGVVPGSATLRGQRELLKAARAT